MFLRTGMGWGRRQNQVKLHSHMRTHSDAHTLSLTHKYRYTHHTGSDSVLCLHVLRMHLQPCTPAAGQVGQVSQRDNLGRGLVIFQSPPTWKSPTVGFLSLQTSIAAWAEAGAPCCQRASSWGSPSQRAVGGVSHHCAGLCTFGHFFQQTSKHLPRSMLCVRVGDFETLEPSSGLKWPLLVGERGEATGKAGS